MTESIHQARYHKVMTVVFFEFLVVAFVISTMPLYYSDYPLGHDLIGSLSRIESMAVTIRQMQFPAVIMPTEANGFGVLGIIYAHLFFYIPAFLKVAGLQTLTAYKVTVWLMQAMAAALMFISMKILRCSDRGALFGAALFLMMPYRIGDLYWRGALSESISMSFLPLMIAVVYRMGTDAKKNGWWIFLAISMTGIFQSHMLTFIMAIVLCTVLCCIYFNRGLIVGIGKAVLLFAILNLWFIVPFLRYFFTDLNILELPRVMADYTGTIKDMLYCIGFTQRPNVIGIGAVLIFILSVLRIGVLIYQKRKGTVEQDFTGMYVFMLITGIVGIYIASAYFPWEFIEARLPFISMFQFPFRFLLIPTVMFSMLAGLLLSDRMLPVLVIAAVAFFSGINEYNCLTGQEIVNNSTVDNYDFDYRIEYLPIGVTSADFCAPEPIIPANFTTVDYKRDYGRVEWSFINNVPENESCIDVPLIYYEGYSADLFDENGSKVGTLETMPGIYHRVRAVIPKNTASGRLVVQYRNKWYMNLATVISAMSVLLLILYSLRNRISVKKSADAVNGES